MMSDKREFKTAAVMGALSGVLLTNIDDVYAVCSYAAGGPVWTHQLPRVGREMQAAMCARSPELQEAIDYIKANCTAENYLDIVAEIERRIGSTMPVSPLSVDEHERIDPMSELAEKVHPDKIITVQAGTK